MKILNLILLVGVSVASTACSIKELDKTKVNSITLTKETQRVVRYNCGNAVASDQIETVSEPEQWVSVTPKADFVVVSSTFKNESTADDANLVNNYTSFKIQYQKRDWGMSVRSGTNQVRYRFYSCNDPSLETCSSSQHSLAEEGTLELDITYQETFRSSTMTVAASNCTPE